MIPRDKKGNECFRVGLKQSIEQCFLNLDMAWERKWQVVGVVSWRGAVSLMRRGQLKQTSITGDGST